MYRLLEEAQKIAPTRITETRISGPVKMKIPSYNGTTDPKWPSHTCNIFELQWDDPYWENTKMFLANASLCENLQGTELEWFSHLQWIPSITSNTSARLFSRTNLHWSSEFSTSIHQITTLIYDKVQSCDVQSRQNKWQRGSRHTKEGSLMRVWIQELGGTRTSEDITWFSPSSARLHHQRGGDWSLVAKT